MSPPQIKKLYHSIGEVSNITGLKQYVLRYWESEFPQLSPAKNRAGNRIYRQKDIDLVLFIKKLLYEKKYTIEGARQKLRELQEQGKPFTEESLEELEGDHRHQAEGQGGISVDQYRRFLQRLRRELQQLLQIIQDSE